jgi:AraC family transcriptional regulator
MDEVIEKAVERAILNMRENLGEPITIDDMARCAMFSKFHFSRIFQRVTGVSPARFLSALRIQEAKKLLRSSSMTVADISHLVGYNSIGTFSSRFRSSVGFSPTEYRHFDGEVPAPLPIPQQRNRRDSATVRGRVWCPRGCRLGLVIVGLFPDRIAQGNPVRTVARLGRGDFVIENVPAGQWHVRAHSAGVAEDMRPDDVEAHDARPYESVHGPIEVHSGQTIRSLDLWLHRPSVFDPPVLLAELDQPAHTWAPGRVEQLA